MKIATLAVSPTAFLHLKGPDGQHLYEAGKPVGIDLFGPGSPEAAVIESAQSARAIKRMQDNDNKIAMPSIEVQREETTADLIAYTAGLRNIEIDGSGDQPLSGNALLTALYSDPALGWIKVQVIKFVADWGKFMPGSPTS
ncbi:hypothetical protein [Sphingomonas sp. CARO-RG-8B-R24-01]|uniref:hypothetical protein n=1 Tax=Sphingomonas sp. CARO-RG-8B-R24-01 TaxID=2914831 RepID=UPI001F5A85A3|nr:hypothetical protein [Sphingomonas sp. CARO-RG-8B-R24-01]